MNRYKNSLLKFILALLVCLYASYDLFAQEDQEKFGTISGTVINASTLEPLVGANITLVGTSQGAVSDLSGRFQIENVSIGIHNLQVSLIGFSTVMVTDVIVSSVKPAIVSARLEESAIQFDQVDVSVDYFRSNPETPLSTSYQSNEEIRRLPGGFEDVLRAVSILPGVAQVQPGRNDLIVRGGAPSENLFLIDKIEVPNINHFGTQGAGGGPLSYINLDFIEGTSFSTGGFGVQYGDRLSSVLTMNLREGRKDRIGGKATIAATQFGASLEGGLSDKGSFIVSARRSYLDFIFKAAGFSFVPEYWDFLGKASYNLGPKDDVTLLGIAALDQTRFFNETADQRYDNSRILGSSQNQIVTGILWRHLFESGYYSVSLNNVFVDFDYGQKDSTLQSVFSNTSRENESALRGDVFIQLSPSAELSFGVQGKLIDARTLMNVPARQTNFGQAILNSTDIDTTAFKGSVYGQISYIVDHWRFTFGSRLDYFSLIANEFAFSPRVSASYFFTTLTSLNLSAGRYVQAPSYIWLMSNPLNRNLSHIGADQIVLGLQHLIREDLKVSVETYVKKYFNYPASTLRRYLVMANTGAGFGGSQEGFASFGIDPLVSEGTGTAKGIEFLAQKKFSEIPCYGTVSLSYNESRFFALDGLSRPGSFDQRWILNVGGGYVLNNSWEFSAKFRLATGRPYTPFNPNGTQSVSLYNTERVGINHSLDVRVDRRWEFSSWLLITYIDIQNIYNKKQRDVPYFDERTQQAKYRDAIGILPSIGISAEF